MKQIGSHVAYEHNEGALISTNEHPAIETCRYHAVTTANRLPEETKETFITRKNYAILNCKRRAQFLNNLNLMLSFNNNFVHLYYYYY